MPFFARRPQPQPRSQKAQRRLGVEALERRDLLATFTVVNTNPGSLAYAIAAANATTDADTIAFNIPGGGVHTIALTSQLTIENPITIDGWSQPGFAGQPLIEITTDARVSYPIHALRINQTDGVLIRGLAITNFSNERIHIEHSSHVKLQANYLGSNAAGDAAASLAGVDIGVYYSTDVVIGSDCDGQQDEIEGNLIVGSFDGVRLYVTNRVTIAGNYIGTNAQKTPGLGNAIGIDLNAKCTSTVIGSNNDGVNDYLERNVIANNSQFGIRQPDASDPFKTLISRNLVYGSGQLDVDLYDQGPTLNHSSNSHTNFPVLTTVQITSSSVVITGELRAKPNQTYRVELFASSHENPSGYGGAERYLGAKSVTTNSSGYTTFSASFATTLPQGWIVTATATDSAGKTSEFALDLSTVPNSPPVIDNYAASPTYVENEAPVTVLADTTTITDANSQNFLFGQIRILIALNGSPDDVIEIPNEGDAVGQFSWQHVGYNPDVYSLRFSGNEIGRSPQQLGTADQPLLITFTTAYATPEVVQSLLRKVTFFNTSESPNTAARGIQFRVNDGDGGDSNRIEQSVAVTSVNDAPTITAPSYLATAQYHAVAVTPAIGDIDAGESLIRFSVSASKGVYTLNPTDGLTFTSGANSTGKFTVQGTLSAIQTALGGGKYTPNANITGKDNLKFTLNDLGASGGGALSVSKTVTINIYYPTFAIDNGWTGYAETGDWSTSSLTGFNGSSTRYSMSPTAMATWTPTIPQAGMYKVEFYRVAHQGSATSARIDIQHAGITTVKAIALSGGTSGFVDLGTYLFDSGVSTDGDANHRPSFVQLYQISSGTIRADAVRFTKV